MGQASTNPLYERTLRNDVWNKPVYRPVHSNTTRERDRERERETDRQTETERERDRRTERQTDRQLPHCLEFKLMSNEAELMKRRSLLELNDVKSQLLLNQDGEEDVWFVL